jgi:hypothetical protein
MRTSPVRFSGQAAWSGKTAAIRSSARMRWMGGGTLAPAGIARNRQRARRVPAPARGEHGGGQQRLREHFFDSRRPQEFEHDFERERVLLAQRDEDAVVGGGGLQFEIEAAAEALAQREAPGAIDARSERRVDHQLHAAAFVEEAFGHHAGIGGHRAERALAGRTYAMPARRPSAIEPAFVGNRAAGGDLRAQCRHLVREFARAPGRFAAPERNGRRAPCASSTRTRPCSTRRMRHEVVPSRKTSPAMLSTAKSSSTCPPSRLPAPPPPGIARYPGWRRPT